MGSDVAGAEDVEFACSSVEAAAIRHLLLQMVVVETVGAPGTVEGEHLDCMLLVGTVFRSRQRMHRAADVGVLLVLMLVTWMALFVHLVVVRVLFDSFVVDDIQSD